MLSQQVSGLGPIAPDESDADGSGGMYENVTIFQRIDEIVCGVSILGIARATDSNPFRERRRPLSSNLPRLRDEAQTVLRECGRRSGEAENHHAYASTHCVKIPKRSDVRFQSLQPAGFQSSIQLPIAPVKVNRFCV